MKEIYMCRKCAEKLIAEGKAKLGASVKEKQTCSQCERRRFVYIVQVADDEPKDEYEVSEPHGYIIRAVKDNSYVYVTGRTVDDGQSKMRVLSSDADKAYVYKSIASATSAMERLMTSNQIRADEAEIISLQKCLENE